MSNHIVIKDLEIECIVGIHDWERKTTQKLSLDVQGHFDFSRVLQSHSFKDTIDYVAVSRRISELVKEKRYQLLETMADEISKTLFAEFPLTSLALEIKKPTPDVSEAKYVGISFKVNKHAPVLSRSYSLDDRSYVVSSPQLKAEIRKIFSGKTALVTGAAKGLGRALAEHLGRLGCNVAVHYRTSGAEAEDLTGILKKSGVRAKSFQGDLADHAAMQKLAGDVKSEFGRIDFLINNVGAYSPKSLWEIAPEEFSSIVQTNICGTYFLTREVLPYMREQKFGRIVNIGQAASDRMRAYKNETAYHISKTGVVILTKSIAATEAKNGITCNLLAPGIMINNTYFPPGLLDSVPMGRLGQFEDFFGALEFLLSPAADYVTGTTIDVTGGYGL